MDIQFYNIEEQVDVKNKKESRQIINQRFLMTKPLNNIKKRKHIKFVYNFINLLKQQKYIIQR
ncbi:hypothetical protein pb186bvf_004968 [Paramecium bursaria]